MKKTLFQVKARRIEAGLGTLAEQLHEHATPSLANYADSLHKELSGLLNDMRNDALDEFCAGVADIRRKNNARRNR
jgi:hypothetical protein